MHIQTIIFTRCPDHGFETMHRIAPQGDGSLHLQCARATGTRPPTPEEAQALRQHGFDLLNMATLSQLDHRPAGQAQVQAAEVTP